jgi:hypothetical protein
VSDDIYDKRKKLTFAQAEGAEPLPSQLKRTDISQQLESLIWVNLYDRLMRSMNRSSEGFGQPFVQGVWKNILTDYHVYALHKPVDEFESGGVAVISTVKAIIFSKNYVKFFSFLQYILRHRQCPMDFANNVSNSLEQAHAYFRLVSKDTFVPLTTDEEMQSVKQAFTDLAPPGLSGAKLHLQNAADALAKGLYADSIRESIHSVESVARILAPSSSLSESLRMLEKPLHVHRALKAAFTSLYEYTSDEKGIRHPLLGKGTANVDEFDAIFMLGACAAFISYLIGKARTTNLLETKKSAKLPSPRNTYQALHDLASGFDPDSLGGTASPDKTG